MWATFAAPSARWLCWSCKSPALRLVRWQWPLRRICLSHTALMPDSGFARFHPYSCTSFYPPRTPPAPHDRAGVLASHLFAGNPAVLCCAFVVLFQFRLVVDLTPGIIIFHPANMPQVPMSMFSPEMRCSDWWAIEPAPKATRKAWSCANYKEISEEASADAKLTL